MGCIDSPNVINDGTKYAPEHVVRLLISYTTAGWSCKMKDQFYIFESPNGRYVKKYSHDGELVKLTKRKKPAHIERETPKESNEMDL